MWKNGAWIGARIILCLLLFSSLLQGCVRVNVQCPPPSGVVGDSEEAPTGCGLPKDAKGEKSFQGTTCTSGKVCPFPGNSCGFPGTGRTCKNWDNGGGRCSCKCD
jgi:hypothetical protein